MLIINATIRPRPLFVQIIEELIERDVLIQNSVWEFVIPAKTKPIDVVRAVSALESLYSGMGINTIPQDNGDVIIRHYQL